MVVVGGIWERGWFNHRDELNLWHYPMKDLGVDELAMSPKARGLLSQKVRQFRSVEEMVQHYGLPIIICTESGDSSLQNFEHPENALYLFNRTSGGQLPVKPDHTLRIETHANKGLLWGHQAASIILYDRLTKQWQ